MEAEREIRDFIYRHLSSIFENNIESYHATSSEDLTLYEWWVTPHRIDGLPFHDFMMTEAERRGAIFGEDVNPEDKSNSRFDLANLHIQHYGDTAIASYTLMISTGLPTGVKVTTHNESRVMVKNQGQWKVVHVHKSPAWPAPHIQP